MSFGWPWRREIASRLAILSICVLLVIPAGANGQAAVATRHQRLTLPLTSFYDTPHPLPAGKPGELIRSEVFDDYYLPVDFVATRILYRSLGPNGEAVAVSGVVLVPDKTAPAGGWPVIVWAHDFAGAARQCAPSLWRNLYYGPLLSMYLNLGYAVVATDYAGLGTGGRSAALDVRSHAWDVIYAIPAAHAAVPQLNKKWVAMGSSLGANVAITVDEMEGGLRDSNYLGSIAIAVVPDLEGSYETTKQQDSGNFAVLAYGIKTVHPDFDVSDMLTAKGLAMYHKMDESCGSPSGEVELPVHEMLKQNWRSNKFVEDFFRRNSLGKKPLDAPLLMIGDAATFTAPRSATTQMVDRLCRQGDRVELDKISDPQAELIVGDSVSTQMAWIKARFAGRTVPDNCP